MRRVERAPEFLENLENNSRLCIAVAGTPSIPDYRSIHGGALNLEFTGAGEAVARVIVNIYTLALDNQGPTPNLVVNRCDIFAQHANEY